MKKFLFAFILVTAAFFTQTAQAQSSLKFNRTTTNSSSTITNAGTDTLSLSLPGYYDIIAFQPVITKTSGTVAGSVIFYGSIDGVNYLPAGDTLTLTNTAKQTAVFTHAVPYYPYWRALATGSGTMVATAQIYYTARKR